MYDELKKRCCAVCHRLAQKLTVAEGEVCVSLRDDATGVYAVQNPRTAPGMLTEGDVWIVDEQGAVLEGDPGAVSTFVVHRVIYEGCSAVRMVVESRCRWSGVWAQLGRSLPPTSFLHARYFSGELPSTGSVVPQPGESVYEAVAGQVKSAFKNRGIPPRGGVFLRNDGVLLWGENPEATAERVAVAEELCLRAVMTAAVNEGADGYVAREVTAQLLEKE